MKNRVFVNISICLLILCLCGCTEKPREKDEIVSYVPTSSGPFVDKASGDWEGVDNGYLMQISVETNTSSGKNYYKINIFGDDEGYPFYYMVGENSENGIVYKYGHKIIKDKDGIEVSEYADDRGQLLIDGENITWKSNEKDIEVEFKR